MKIEVTDWNMDMYLTFTVTYNFPNIALFEGVSFTKCFDRYQVFMYLKDYCFNKVTIDEIGVEQLKEIILFYGKEDPVISAHFSDV